MGRSDRAFIRFAYLVLNVATHPLIVLYWHIDASLDHEFFDIAKTQVEPELHTNSTLDDIMMKALVGVN